VAKRVLIFSLAYYPGHVSGAEAAIREITDRIDPTAIEFEMITLLFDAKQPRQEKIGTVLVHRVGVGSKYLSKILFIPLVARTAIRLHHARPFDGLWAMMTYMLFPIVLMRLCFIRIPYVLTLQDGDSYEKVFERWFIRPVAPLLDYGFRHATVIQAISSYLATWPKRRGSRAPVEVVYNGSDPGDLVDDLFTEEDLTRIKNTLGKKEGDIFLVNTARLVPQKAFDSTIRALKKLPINIKFLVVGGGSEETSLKSLVAALQLQDRVIFTGQVDRADVTIYRRISDIFVMPSRSEGLGNAGLSAMASRIPMIATQEGGLAEYVFDAKRNPDKPTTGWAVDPDSPEQIAEAVKDIMAHPEKVKEVTERARRMVEEKFDWGMIAKNMKDRVFSKLFTIH
jgi:glycosyltransferase involved in cell wall biosynthesis